MDLVKDRLRHGKYDKSVKMSVREDEKLATLSYLHSGVDFTSPFVRKCRGYVVDKNFDTVVRGFEKFFNYKQFDTTNEYDSDFRKIYTQGFIKDKKYRVFEKLDGTMINASYNDTYGLVLSTTSSCKINNKFTQTALQLITEDMVEYMKACVGYTFVFEYVSPNNQIVVPYEKEDLVLLGVVENETGNMFFKDDPIYDDMAVLGVATPTIYYKTLEELLSDCKTLVGIEGYVAVNEHGRLVKFKTDYWFEKHGQTDLFFGMLTESKVRTIVQARLDKTIDDLYGYQNQHELYKSRNIVGKVEREFQKLMLDVLIWQGQYLDASKKEIALSSLPAWGKAILFASNKEAEDRVVLKLFPKMIYDKIVNEQENSSGNL